MIDGDFENAVAIDLANIGNPAAGYVLAHQHTQSRRLERTDFLLRGQMCARAVRACGEQKQVIPPVVSNGEVQFVAFRLYNSIDSAADERVAKFV